MTGKELAELRYLRMLIGRDRQKLAELPEDAERKKYAKKLERDLRELERKERRIEEWLMGVEDMRIRTALTLRYIDGKSWGNIAMRMGGGNTSNGIYMAVKRYMDKQGSR